MAKPAKPGAAFLWVTPKIMKSVEKSKNFDVEVIRLIESMPLWIPERRNNQPIKSKRIYIICPFSDDLSTLTDKRFSGHQFWFYKSVFSCLCMEAFAIFSSIFIETPAISIELDFDTTKGNC